MLLNRPEPVGPVAASTTKNDPDDALSEDFGGGYEQGVGCRTGVVDFRSLIQSDAAGLQKHVMIRRRYIDTSSFDWGPVVSKCRMKSSGTGQKGRQHAGVTANVDDDEKRRRAPDRQRRNKATQGLKATGGTCDYHHCVHDPEPAARKLWFSSLVATPAAARRRRIIA